MDRVENRWCRVPNAELDNCISRRKDVRPASEKDFFKIFIAKVKIIRAAETVQIVCKDFKPHYVAYFDIENIWRWFKEGYLFCSHVSRKLSCFLIHGSFGLRYR